LPIDLVNQSRFARRFGASGRRQPEGVLCQSVAGIGAVFVTQLAFFSVKIKSVSGASGLCALCKLSAIGSDGVRGSFTCAVFGRHTNGSQPRLYARSTGVGGFASAFLGSKEMTMAQISYAGCRREQIGRRDPERGRRS